MFLAFFRFEKFIRDPYIISYRLAYNQAIRTDIYFGVAESKTAQLTGV